MTKWNNNHSSSDDRIKKLAMAPKKVFSTRMLFLLGSLAILYVFIWCTLTILVTDEDKKEDEEDHSSSIMAFHHEQHGIGNDKPLRHSSSSSNNNNNNNNNNLQVKNDNDRNKPAITTIAYSVTVTKCVKDRNHFFILDEAAILEHSIYINSIRNNNSSNDSSNITKSVKSKYDYKMFAHVHPSAKECGLLLEQYGYEVLVRETPIHVEQIEGKVLRESVRREGCCGELEFLKLYAYLLTNYPIVVQLDIDSMLLQPMDELFDAMLPMQSSPSPPPPSPSNTNKERKETNQLSTTTTTATSSSSIPVMYDAPMPAKIDAYFTRDYSMSFPGQPHVGIQGGFLVIRPSQEAFGEYVDIIHKGNYTKDKGWGNMGFGGFYGAAQIQGVTPYFYDVFHPGTAVELNRCRYGFMADPPYVWESSHPQEKGKCRDGMETCEDCRDTPMEKIRTVHFTVCRRTWMCRIRWDGAHLFHNFERLEPICSKLHRHWFALREDYEQNRLGTRTVPPPGEFHKEQFRGYCTEEGRKGYIPIGNNEPLGLQK